MLKHSILFCFILWSSWLWAAQTRVEIKRVSQSGRTILLNIGSYIGIKEGDRAKLVYVQHPGYGKYFEVATIELIKSYPNYSYWAVKSKEVEQELDAGMQLLMIPYRDLLNGKRPYRFLNKRVIVDGFNNQDSYIVKSKTTEGDNPVYKKEQHDVYINHLEQSDSEANQIIQQVFGNYEVSKRGEFKLLEYDDPFYLKDTPNSYTVREQDRLFRQHQQDRSSSEIIRATSNRLGEVREREFDDTNDLYAYEKYLYSSGDVRSDFMVHQELVAADYIDVNRENRQQGALWSASMSVDSIRRYLLRSGFAKEYERQQFALQHRKGHEFFLRYTFDTSSNLQEQDKGALQGISHALSIGFGYHLGMTSPVFDNWVINFSYTAGDDYYDMGGAIFKSMEKAMRVMVDYYLYGSPDAIGRYIWFAGAGFKLGKAQLISGNYTGQVFDYDLSSFKSFHLGFRYRFDGGDERYKIKKFGYGLTVAAMYEQTRVAAAYLGTMPREIYAETYVDDIRVTMGLDIFF